MASIPLLRLSLRPTATVTTATHHRDQCRNSPILFRPLKSATTALFPVIAMKSKTPRKPRIVAMSSSSTTPATDRLIASVGYFLPFLNGLRYGRFLFAQYPKLYVLFEPLLPLLSLYKSVPYGSFVPFFALYLGVVRNPSFSPYVRFNAMQALVLDVLLVVPSVFQQIFTPGQAGLGFKVMVMIHNVVFLSAVACFLYSWVSTILGRTPYLPFVADAARRQL
uniref:Protein TIC 20 n=1 Tax=Opuntia streptacantha TaxID=393608 RepID=A0A7C8ZHK2_OPUST